ncbi:hypothetical protein VNO78_16070 [Psophocarpus tetragonolobus]|uniref:Uncharacterized protein n=1 Tax=Psophocarpus tetragonolobus TaxID=3891 RepID=A0AAN9SGH9_PSOTE
MYKLNNGLPLKISSPYRSYFLFPGSKLDLSFTTVPTCASTPSAWTVVKGLSGQPLVKVTGYENTLNGYFAIQESSTGFSLQNSYKFQFCTFDSDECANIGIVKGDNNDRQLGLISEDDPAFMFVLVNAETSSSSA